MFFWIKKALTLPFLPLYFALGAGLVGVVLLWRRNGSRAGRWLVTGAVGVLLVFSNKGVALALLQPLEQRYPAVPEATSRTELPPPLQACEAIIVLGGGHGDAPTLSRVNQLSASSLARMTEAVRLSRLLPDAQVIFAGHHPEGISHARVVSEAALSLGLDPARVVLFEQARDTGDEAAALFARMGTRPVALVTSAWHMPRAVRTCEAAGAQVVPCPADFALKPGADTGLELLAWDLGALERSTRGIRERLGMLWLTLRGKTLRE